MMKAAYQVKHISGTGSNPKIAKRKKVVKVEIDPVEKELRKHFLKMHKSKQSGSGFFDKALNGIKNIISGTKNIVDKTKERVVGTINGRSKLPPSVRRLLEQHGADTISNITVCREPLQSMLSKAMNLLTLGKLNSITDKMGYDDLFHLYMVITTSKGVKLVFI